MRERANALVPVYRDLPAGLTDAERQIRLVPSSRYERLVENADTVDALPSDRPRPDDRVHFEAAGTN